MANTLAVLDNVQKQLARITTVEEAKKFRDQIAALQHYAKVSKQSLKDQNAVALVKFKCERRAGELLLQVPKVQGTRNGDTGLLLTIKRSGISTQTAYRWMALAQVPDADLLRWAALCDAHGDELTSTLVYNVLVPQGSGRRGVPIEWDVLAEETLEGLSPEARRVLVAEIRSTYEDYCVDVPRGKVLTPGGWNPAIAMDTNLLRALALAVVRDLRAGTILTPGQVRLRLRGLYDKIQQRWDAREERLREGRPLGPRPAPARTGSSTAKGERSQGLIVRWEMTAQEFVALSHAVLLHGVPTPNGAYRSWHTAIRQRIAEVRPLLDKLEDAEPHDPDWSDWLKPHPLASVPRLGGGSLIAFIADDEVVPALEHAEAAGAPAPV